MEAISGFVATLGAVTLIAQVTLYGPLSGKTEERPPIGERVERWLIGASSWLDGMRESRVQTLFTWGRRLVLGYLIFMFVWAAYVGADAAIFDGALPWAEDSPVDAGDALVGILLIAIVLPFLAVIIGVAVAGFYAVQWAIFGLRGKRSLLVVLLQFMGSHQKRVLAISGGLTSVFGALAVLL